MKVFNVFLSLILFTISCKKKDEDTTCRTHSESALSEGSYFEKDSSSSFFGKKTLDFKLKIDKRIYDSGVCNFGHAPQCSKEWTISNLTDKNVIITVYNLYTQSVLPHSNIIGYYPLNSGDPCLLSIKEIESNIKVKYN